MSDAAYNGWTNYPTRAVNLWLSNDESLYDEARALVADRLVYVDHSDDNVKQGIWTVEQARRFHVSDDLKSWVRDDIAPDLGASFAADLLGYALDQVNWYEIADAWIADMVEEAACC